LVHLGPLALIDLGQLLYYASFVMSVDEAVFCLAWLLF